MCELLEALRVRGKGQQSLKKGDFQDLNFDRSRAFYEFELRADLGDVMMEICDLPL